LFFFVNDEELKRSLGQTVLALVPDANAHNGLLPCSVAGASFACNPATNLANVGVNPKIASILALYPLPTAPASSPGAGSIREVDTQVGRENYLLARVDYNLSEKNSLFVRYVRDYGDTTLPFLGSPLPPRWPEIGQTRNQFATVEYRRVISPTMVNLLRFSFT